MSQPAAPLLADTALGLLLRFAETLAQPEMSRRAVYNTLEWLSGLPERGGKDMREEAWRHLLASNLAWQIERQGGVVQHAREFVDLACRESAKPAERSASSAIYCHRRILRPQRPCLRPSRRTSRSTSMSTYHFVQPLDVLMIRGNKSFGGDGQHGQAVMPPWPSLFAGAFRSALLGKDAVQLASFAHAGDRLAGDLGAVLGSRDEPGSFAINWLSLGSKKERCLSDFESLHPQ